MSTTIHNETKAFKITFNNDLFSQDNKIPFRSRAQLDRKQTTLEKYFIYPKKKINKMGTKPTPVLLNWKICYYSSSFNNKIIDNHYLDGNLICGKGWVTSDIINISIKSNYLEVLTETGSKYKLYLYDSYSNINGGNTNFTTLYIGTGI